MNTNTKTVDPVDLYDEPGFSIIEAAAALKVSVGTVRNRIKEDAALVEAGQEKINFPNAFKSGDNTRPWIIPERDIRAYKERTVANRA